MSSVGKLYEDGYATKITITTTPRRRTDPQKCQATDKPKDINFTVLLLLDSPASNCIRTTNTIMLYNPWQ